MKRFLIIGLLILTAPVWALEGGDIVGRNIFGLAMDAKGNPVMLDGEPLIHSGAGQSVDFAQATQRFRVTAFGDAIGSLFVTQMGAETGMPIDTEALNLDSIGGLAAPGLMQETLWNTALLGETGAIDAANPAAFIETFKPYFNQRDDRVNPYHYGWLTEVVVLDDKGAAKAIKSYAAGRVMADQLWVMPDARTFYLLDSQHAGHLYVFVSEQPNSLSKGELFVAHSNKGRIKLESLGKSSALKVKFKLKKAVFDQVFERQPLQEAQCRKGFKLAHSHFGTECLKPHKRNKRYTGLLEPARYAAWKGWKAIDGGIKTAEFDALQKSVTLHTHTQRLTLVLASDSKIGSDYILQETP